MATVRLKRDEQHHCCGFLEMDTSQGAGKSYERYYFVLDTEQNLFLYYSEDPKYTNHEPKGDFNISYMSMVEDAACFKSRNPLCLVLTERGKAHYLKARNEDEKQAWIKELQNSARIKAYRRESSRSEEEEEQRGNYQARIAGGVVVQQHSSFDHLASSSTQSDSESEKDDELAEKYASFSLTSAQRARKTGYCTKQGIIIKTWKRRWFVLAEGGLAYYRAHEEKSPIRVIPRPEIIGARRSVGIHMGRDNLFEVVTPNRVFYIQAESSFDCDDWIQEICNMLNPTRRKSEAMIQTDHSGSLRHSNPTAPQVKHQSTPSSHSVFYV